MTGPLTRTEGRLNSRFRNLEQKLNDELAFRDRRLHFAKRADRTGTTTWLLRNKLRTDTEESALPRAACELAVSPEDAAAIHVAYNEQWASAGRRVGLRFKSSNLRFIITTTDPDGLPLQFRLEWAGRYDDGSGVLSYPGRGAAHPHWQFDVDAGWESDSRRAEDLIDLALAAPDVENVDLDADAGKFPPIDRGRTAFPWFHRLHLPARAMWHEAICLMPTEARSQQHEPGSPDEIDRWVLSALRYVRHEFSTYA